MQPQFVSAPLIAQVQTFGTKLGFVQTFQFQNVHRIIYKHVKQHFSQKVNNLDSKIFEWYKQKSFVVRRRFKTTVQQFRPNYCKVHEHINYLCFNFLSKKKCGVSKKMFGAGFVFLSEQRMVRMVTTPRRADGWDVPTRSWWSYPVLSIPIDSQLLPSPRCLSRKWKSWPFVFSQVPRVTN